ncbi:MAG TPA: SDR family NAD(P)-dependent oxidoreductase [Candidatus Dormibacteraeota bacterium]
MTHLTTGTALVTGASRGLGQYIARSLAGRGYNLVLTGRTAAGLESLAEELRTSGRAALAVAADLTDEGDQDRVLQAAEREFGHVDVLVNNAGGDPQREFEAMPWRENEAIIRLNLLAPMQLTHKLLPRLLGRRRGHIVNISSIAGRVGFPYAEAYAAAKDGLIAFTRVLRHDYRARGVSASAVILGAIRDAGQGQRTSDEMGLQMPRLGTSPAHEVGAAVLTAIARDRAEIVVMPGPGRVLKAALDLSPALGERMNRMAGADATMRRVIEFRRAQSPQ